MNLKEWQDEQAQLMLDDLLGIVLEENDNKPYYVVPKGQPLYLPFERSREDKLQYYEYGSGDDYWMNVGSAVTVGLIITLGILTYILS